MQAAFRFLPFIVAASTAMLSPSGCTVDEYCYSNADCSAPRICTADGTCALECVSNAECGIAMECSGNRCVPDSSEPIVCPGDMANVADAFCIDLFEASRKDATPASVGSDETAALSREGVLPWQLDEPEENATAAHACEAAGKQLCTPQQWMAACQGPAKTVYGYGDAYEPATCNGIDLFGLSGYRVLPTGSLAACRNGWGALDMNGNLWEHTQAGSERTVRGGAYNCKDSQTLHRCDYVPSSWTPSARGFRCCLVPEGGTGLDAGVDGAVDSALPDAGLQLLRLRSNPPMRS